MPSGDVNWNSVPGLKAAAARLETEARRFELIVSRFHGAVNIWNPETFGDSKGAREFFTKFKRDSGEWDEGIRGVGRSIWATATGVDIMADAFLQTDHDTADAAEYLRRHVSAGGGAPSGGGGGGVPGLPGNPAATSPGGTGSGGGNSGGHGRRH